MFSFDCCKATNKKPKLLPKSIIYIRRENIYYVVHAGYTVKSMCVDSSVAYVVIIKVNKKVSVRYVVQESKFYFSDSASTSPTFIFCGTHA